MDAQGKAYIDPSLFDTGPVVVFKWGTEPVEGNPWPVRFVTANVAELLGYSPDSFLKNQHRFSDLVYPKDLARVASEVSHALDTGTSRFTHQDYRLRHRDGHYIWVMDVTMINWDESGEPESFHGYLVDITERKTAEQELEGLPGIAQELQGNKTGKHHQKQIVEHAQCDADRQAGP